MVDTVNGQTDPFEAGEILGSRIEARVSRVTDASVELEFEGNTESESTQEGEGRSPRGIVTELLGSAIFDRASQHFTKFEIVAIGTRWGYTRFNDRVHEQRDSNPLGFVFQIAPADEPPSVPAFIWMYDAHWLYGQ